MVDSSLVSFNVRRPNISRASDTRAAEASRLSLLEAPHTAVEQALAVIWVDILRLDQVGRDDDFFSLGGDSMAAMRVLLRVQEIFQLELEPQDLFEARTVRALAQRIIDQILAEAGAAAASNVDGAG